MTLGTSRAQNGPVFKTCLYCGVEYQSQCASRLWRSKYCSHSCSAKARGTKENLSRFHGYTKIGGKPDNLKPLNCEICGKTYKPTGNKQRLCKECAPTDTWAVRCIKYGVSKSIWEDMLYRQGGHCALCNKPATVVDHDHKTGKVRGLLCHGCNRQIAALDDSAWFEKAKRYIE